MINKANADISNNRDSQYEDIFSEDVVKLENIAELFRKGLQTREILLENLSELLRKSDLLCRAMSHILMKITWIVVLKILRILVKKVFKNIGAAQ